MRSILLSISALSLAACGGGGGVTTSVVGFAQPSSEIAVGFKSSAETVTAVSNGTTPATVSQRDVSFAVTDTTQVTVTIDGTPYVLDLDGSFYRTTQGNLSVLFFLESLRYDDLEFGWLFQENLATGEAEGGYIVWGFKTDPVEVAAQSGTATYTGQARFDVYNATTDEYGSGSIQLVTDFASDTISGTMILSDIDGLAGGLGGLPDATVTINPAAITSNGFSTTTSTVITGANLNGAVINPGTLEGTFFGSNAPRVGGTFSATGTNALGDDLAVQGGFVAER